MKHLLFILAGCFCCGIILAGMIRVPFYPLYLLTFALLLLGFLTAGRPVFALVFIAFPLILGALILENHRILARNHILHIMRDDGIPCIAGGSIINTPESGNNRVSFLLRCDELRQAGSRRSCSGYILVRLKGEAILRAGDRVVLRGVISKTGDLYFRSRGYLDYLHNQGIFVVMKAEAAGLISVKGPQGFSLMRFAAFAREKLERTLFAYLSPACAGILDAMVLGNKKGVPQLVYSAMIRTGTVHILVVSGFNVGIVLLLIVFLLKIMRVNRRLRLYLALPCIVLYCFMTGASTPVARATIMSVFFIAGLLMRREPDVYNSLAMAGLSILAVNPCQIFEASFQLSFASVLAIVLLYPRLQAISRLSSLKPKALKYLCQGFLVSLCAWLGTAGFIAYYFRIFSPATLIANIFIVPLAALITLCGFSLALAALLCQPAAPLFAQSATTLVILLLNINNLVLKMPGACFSW